LAAIAVVAALAATGFGAAVRDHRAHLDEKTADTSNVIAYAQLPKKKAPQPAPLTTSTASGSGSSAADLAPTVGQLPDGCHIEIKNGNLTVGFVTLPKASKNRCEDLFLADEFNHGHDGRRDFYLLLRFLGYPVQDSVKLIRDVNKDLSVLYKQGTSIDRFESVSTKARSIKCEWFDFFGVKLYCFNEVTASPGKYETLRYVIPLLTVLKYTSGRPLWNPLLGKNVDAFGFFKSKVSAAAPLVDAQGLVYEGKDMKEESGCEADGTGPSASGGNERGKIYLCPALLDPKSLSPDFKLHNVAILYHEANHYLDAYSHNKPDPTKGHVTYCEDPGRIEKNKDRDLKGVFGAHIFYLIDMSQNPRLSCPERMRAHQLAVEHTENNLCQKPTAPTPPPSPGC